MVNKKELKQKKKNLQINLEIRTCPVSTNNNYLKNVYNLPLIQYNPDDIFMVPKKEIILKNTIIIKPGKRRPVVVKGRNNIRNVFIKYSILYLTKGIFIKYFNRWKHR